MRVRRGHNKHKRWIRKELKFYRLIPVDCFESNLNKSYNRIFSEFTHCWMRSHLLAEMPFTAHLVVCSLNEGVSTGTDHYNLHWLRGKKILAKSLRIKAFERAWPIHWGGCYLKPCNSKLKTKYQMSCMMSVLLLLTVSCFRSKEKSQGGWWLGFFLHQMIHRFRDAKVDVCADVTHRTLILCQMFIVRLSVKPAM